MAVDDIWQVTLRCQQGDQAGINVLHYVVSESPGIEATANDVADYFDNIFSTPLKALLVDSAQYLFTEASKVFPLPASVRGMSDDGAGEGGWASDPMPRQTCGLITKLTYYAGRQYRGRIYVPFPAQTADSGTAGPDGVYIGLLEDFGLAYKTSRIITGPLGPSSFLPCLYHRDTNAHTLVQDIRASTRWATQRRRSSFGRPNPIP